MSNSFMYYDPSTLNNGKIISSNTVNVSLNHASIWTSFADTYHELYEVVREWIDNSISSGLSFYNSKKDIKIRVVIKHMNGDAWSIRVVDNCSGIKTDYCKYMLSVDTSNNGLKKTSLNEHSKGAKSALSALNPTNDNWHIRTMTSDDNRNNRHTLIRAPWCSDMKVEVVRGSIPEFEFTHGTCIFTTFHQNWLVPQDTKDSQQNRPKTQKGKKSTERKIILALGSLREYLSNIYLDLLEDIDIDFRVLNPDNSDYSGVTQGRLIPTHAECHDDFKPLTGTLNIVHDGKNVPVKYEFFKLAPKSRQKSQLYYPSKKNSGVEMRHNGVLIQRALYEPIFGDIKRGDVNTFFGVIDILGDVLPKTISTKNGYVYNDPLFVKIKNEIKTNVVPSALDLLQEGGTDKASMHRSHLAKLRELYERLGGEIVAEYLPDPDFKKYSCTLFRLNSRTELYVHSAKKTQSGDVKNADLSLVETLKNCWDLYKDVNGSFPSRGIIMCARGGDSTIRNYVNNKLDNKYNFDIEYYEDCGL